MHWFFWKYSHIIFLEIKKKKRFDIRKNKTFFLTLLNSLCHRGKQFLFQNTQMMHRVKIQVQDERREEEKQNRMEDGQS